MIRRNATILNRWFEGMQLFVERVLREGWSRFSLITLSNLFCVCLSFLFWIGKCRSRIYLCDAYQILFKLNDHKEKENHASAPPPPPTKTQIVCQKNTVFIKTWNLFLNTFSISAWGIVLFLKLVLMKWASLNNWLELREFRRNC